MNALEELDDLGPLADDLRSRARAAGVRLIWRAQAVRSRSVVVREGRPETTATGAVAGHGVHVVSEDGAAALASRDDLRPDAATALFDRTVRAAREGRDLGSPVRLPSGLEVERQRAVPPAASAVERIDLADATRVLVDLEERLRGEFDGVRVRSAFRGDLDAWRIVREDGTDVLFAMPRCTVSVRCSAGRDGDRHGIGVAAHLPHPSALASDDFLGPLTRQARSAADLARRLPDAPHHPAGSFPIVIDYALAKGLAHEAFGHASESDGVRSSVLARNGRFERGRLVGAEHVSIVDEPVADDHAWQPYSANGVRRERVTIVRRGRLLEALTDLFSATDTGTRPTGAGRAASFRDPPLPRMTNIRIEVDSPLDAPGRFEEYGPEQVRDLLSRAGVFRRHAAVAFLSGYGGGQVNTTTGDFVFHCKSIWRLGEGGISLFRPAVFAGSMFGALGAIREAFGPLRLDALGWCGKWGQSVPSSGGSHWFLVLDPHPDVRLGGKA